VDVVRRAHFPHSYRGCISPEVAEFLHGFYEMVVFLLNTVIFALAGGLLGRILVIPSLHTVINQYVGTLRRTL
jgi:hypothetical protein